jgi:hypothetical protein
MDARPGEQSSGSPKEGQGQLKVTVSASNGAQIRVWRENDLYYARPAGSAVEPQICVGVDLFEVIAELAGLNLEVKAESTEAVVLSLEVQRQLEDPPGRLEDASGSE